MSTIREISRDLLRAGVAFYTKQWPDYSRLILMADIPSWSIAHDMLELAHLARQLGLQTRSPFFAVHGQKQSVFIGSHFDLLLSDRWFQTNHRLGTAYFHGKPGQGVKEFDLCFQKLEKKHHLVHRIQVSCDSMLKVVLSTGIAPKKVHLIPIGINPTFFNQQTSETRMFARRNFGIPHNAFVVGSFQKDGNGWGEGLDPKMIKGPDIFVKTMGLLNKKVGNLVVLLSGPARGYTKMKLKEAGVQYVHHQVKEYSDVGKLYHALDVYMIPSREEGGPKAVLESMASGIPLIATRVGQALDLVQHGENGWLVENEDVEGLANSAYHILELGDAKQVIASKAIATAADNTYISQLPKWKDFFKGFVESHIR